MDTSMNYLKINQASGRHRTIERANHHHLSIWDWANWSLQHEENLGKLGSEFLTHWSIVGKMNRRFFDALGRKNSCGNILGLGSIFTRVWNDYQLITKYYICLKFWQSYGWGPIWFQSGFAFFPLSPFIWITNEEQEMDLSKKQCSLQHFSHLTWKLIN